MSLSVSPGFSEDNGEPLLQLSLDGNFENTLGSNPTFILSSHPTFETEPSFGEGHEGKAWVWDGNTAISGQLSNLEYRTESFTISCWLKVESLETSVTVFSVGFPKSMLQVVMEGGAYPGVSAFLSYYAGGRLDSVAKLNPDVDLFDGAWHQFSVVVDRDRLGELRFYVDGKLASAAETAFVPDLSWHAGANSTQDSFFVLGAATPWSLTLPNAKSVQEVQVALDDVSFLLGIPANFQKTETLSPVGDEAGNAAEEAVRSAL